MLFSLGYTLLRICCYDVTAVAIILTDQAPQANTNGFCCSRIQEKKNYETYKNERKKQVFASSSKFQIKRVR